MGPAVREGGCVGCPLCRPPRVKHNWPGPVTTERSSDVIVGVDLGTSGVGALATDGLGRRLGMTHRSRAGPGALT